ncbi:PAS domain-containing sensor histidine kinase [Methanoplanus sp. FWC-SCC4]|uniref:histidine kinase n=1 Tax=Methanochimaera problematica TaxID=2609417 RepID=A0AA97F9W0_9EURY|nr:PAS domain-containing sensor histidine kinase [Methanoplanus sp. FWC-SCC4]WOF15247.1 PAS domain-containing sensor histidine kinase [Methanoplanus sp. FWC-SCC4]
MSFAASLKDENLKTYIAGAIVILLFLIMEITYQVLFESTTVVLSHLFYFPVIIASFFYPKRGVIISTLISLIYIILIYDIVYPDYYGIISATMQFYVYISLSVIVSIISARLKSEKIKYKRIFNYSEGGVFVIEKETGKILERNKKFTDMLDEWGFPQAISDIYEICNEKGNMKQICEKIHENGIIENFEIQIKNNGESEYYCLISGSKIPNNTIVFTVTDITKKIVDSKEIMKLNAQLKEANDEANLYIDILTHDINNANTAAQGYAELLYDATTSEADKPFFEKMLSGIRQSSNIISKVSKIRDIHKSGIVSEPFDLDSSVKRAVGKINQGHNITYKQTDLSVMAGKFLDDAFEYILENSVEYGGENVSVFIETKDTGSDAEIVIRDDGPGIPDNRKNNLFTRFQPGVDKRRGRGLGLPLCWHIINSYGGEITAKDAFADENRKGTKIIIKLKKAA